ncbi:MAG TPA: metallophosphoesterase, partial [Devosia sp.]|nr:metallophosphoesterase [Devosia sp.]
ITLAHISDVHLAPLPPVRAGELFSKRLLGYLNWRLRRHSSLSGTGLDTLIQHMREQKPDFTAITGDLVNLGIEAEAGKAAAWLESIGSTRNTCVSPGNHDAYVRTSLGHNSKAWGDYMRGETLDKAQFPFVRRVGDVAIISCSSAVPSPPLFAIGRFEEDQAARLERILKMLGESGYFRVIMIHHPPNLEARHPRLGLYGAKRFRAAVAAQGAELILHGHTHKSSIFAIPGLNGDVPVVGVAAAGAAQAEDGGEDPARYNLFKIERLGTAWSCTMREFGFQRLSSDIVLRLSLRIY